MMQHTSAFSKTNKVKDLHLELLAEAVSNNIQSSCFVGSVHFSVLNPTILLPSQFCNIGLLGCEHNKPASLFGDDLNDCFSFVTAWLGNVK
jgi:hypothetical protein